MWLTGVQSAFRAGSKDSGSVSTKSFLVTTIALRLGGLKIVRARVEIRAGVSRKDPVNMSDGIERSITYNVVDWSLKRLQGW
jgi:hypothetical protein